MGILHWQLVGHRPDEGPAIPASTVLSVLDDVRTAEVRRVEFLGDADRRPDFFELLEYAVGRGIAVGFTSSGALIDEPTARWLAAARDVDFTLLIDDEQSGAPLEALRLFARLPVRGFTVKVPADCVPRDEVLHLADRCRARLRSDRPARNPALFIDVAGDIFAEDNGVKVGSILAPGGLLAACGARSAR